MSDTVGTHPSTTAEKNPPVLVATDFSDDSKAALIWACRYAANKEASLILLHVVHDPVSSPGFYRNSKEDQMVPMQTVAESMMNDFLDKLKAEKPGLINDRSLDVRLVPGLPPSRIVEVAGLLQVDLIVLGNRGLTGLPHKLLGSTAERVVELSAVPVVVVKSEDFRKLSEESRKKKEKKLKKDRKKLKKMLGLGKQEKSGDDGGG
jgi:nucleotide-binding universal stress UspA family protein